MAKPFGLEFWGVRGSMPVCGRGMRRYGGHTLCSSLVSPAGERIIIDAGTGIKRLGDRLLDGSGTEPLRLHLFLTHFHLDHLMGLPFFAPLYSPRTRLVISAPAAEKDTRRALDALMAGSLFPLDFDQTTSNKEIRRVPDNAFELGGLEVSTCPLHHPQGCVAYRFSDGERSFVMSTDTEHPESGIDERLAAFAEGTDVLVYDAMFTPEDYRSKRKGWGHSTWAEAVKLARAAEVRRLFLSHYSYDYKDETIDGIVAAARRCFPRTDPARERS